MREYIGARARSLLVSSGHVAAWGRPREPYNQPGDTPTRTNQADRSRDDADGTGERTPGRRCQKVTAFRRRLVARTARRSACSALALGWHGWFWRQAASGAEPSRKKVDFNFQVRPILSDKCFNCHGPDPRQRKAGLRLDTKEGAFGANKSGGHAIVPGNLEDSELVARITAEDESERMPPKSLGRSLSRRRRSTCSSSWIEQGAEWKPHWAFLPPVAAPLPDCQRTGVGPKPDRSVRAGPARRRAADARRRGRARSA